MWRGAHAACVGHIVDEDGAEAAHVADEHHATDLVGALALLVDEREFHLEVLGDGGDALGATGVRRDHDAVVPVRYVLFNPLAHIRLRVQVVHRDVEKALRTRGFL